MHIHSSIYSLRPEAGFSYSVLKTGSRLLPISIKLNFFNSVQVTSSLDQA
jgi:hypothetical protein